MLGGLSLVAARGGSSPVAVLRLLVAVASRCRAGAPGTRASVAVGSVVRLVDSRDWAQELWCTGLAAPRRG